MRMSKRLQVLLDESEYRDLQRSARRHRMTVSEWVRQVLRHSQRREPLREPARKLLAVREGARHAFPTADVPQMLADIERGYGGGPEP